MSWFIGAQKFPMNDLNVYILFSFTTMPQHLLINAEIPSLSQSIILFTWRLECKYYFNGNHLRNSLPNQEKETNLDLFLFLILINKNKNNNDEKLMMQC